MEYFLINTNVKMWLNIEKIFLDEMKKLLPYLVEFSEDRSMILKEYPKNYAVGKSSKQLATMITYNESMLPANDG